MSFEYKFSTDAQFCINGVTSTIVTGVACASAWGDLSMVPYTAAVFGMRLVAVFYMTRIPTYFASNRESVKSYLNQFSEEKRKFGSYVLIVAQFAIGLFVATSLHGNDTGTSLSYYKINLLALMCVSSIATVSHAAYLIEKINKLFDCISKSPETISKKMSPKKV